MAASPAKLLERLRETRKNFSSRELARILKAQGFEAREGPHTMYRHAQYTDILVNVPRTDNVPPVYSQRVLRAIERVAERQEQEGQE